MYYKGIQDVLKDQYNKGLLTVDFQAMLDMDQCPACHGARLRKESLHVMIESTLDKKKKNLADQSIRKWGTTTVLQELFRK
jgi:excinuclease UvrABC ATPase subunit